MRSTVKDCAWAAMGCAAAAINATVQRFLVKRTFMASSGAAAALGSRASSSSVRRSRSWPGASAQMAVEEVHHPIQDVRGDIVLPRPWVGGSRREDQLEVLPQQH